jgi:hypothetical protein
MERQLGRTFPLASINWVGKWAAVTSALRGGYTFPNKEAAMGRLRPMVPTSSGGISTLPLSFLKAICGGRELCQSGSKQVPCGCHCACQLHDVTS